MSAGNSVFADFKEAQSIGSGPLLAAALTPAAPAQFPDKLRSFYYSTNAVNVSSDLRYALFQDRNTGVKLPKQEQNAWLEIFTAFWKAVGEILKVEESRSSWNKVFSAWKEVANVLIRAYSSSGLQAWTVPCLYVVGRYLRTFAMRADAETSSQDSGNFDNGFQDDFVGEFNKNVKLEDAARTINRMFTLCLSDRYVRVTGGNFLLYEFLVVN